MYKSEAEALINLAEISILPSTKQAAILKQQNAKGLNLLFSAIKFQTPQVISQLCEMIKKLDPADRLAILMQREPDNGDNYFMFLLHNENRSETDVLAIIKSFILLMPQTMTPKELYQWLDDADDRSRLFSLIAKLYSMGTSERKIAEYFFELFHKFSLADLADINFYPDEFKFALYDYANCLFAEGGEENKRKARHYYGLLAHLNYSPKTILDTEIKSQGPKTIPFHFTVINIDQNTDPVTLYIEGLNSPRVTETILNNYLHYSKLPSHRLATLICQMENVSQIIDSVERLKSVLTNEDLVKISRYHLEAARYIFKHFGNKLTPNDKIQIGLTHLEIAQKIHSTENSDVLSRPHPELTIKAPPQALSHRHDPELIANTLASFNREEIKKLIVCYEIAHRLVTENSFEQKLDRELLDLILNYHPDLGVLVLKNKGLYKILLPQQLVALGLSHRGCAELITQSDHLRNRLSEKQLCEMCKDKFELKFLLLRNGNIKYIDFEYVDWELAETLITGDISDLSPHNLYLLCCRFLNISYQVYFNTKFSKHLAQFTLRMETNIAWFNRDIAEKFLLEEKLFDFSADDIASIISKHKALANRITAHPRYNKIIDDKVTALKEVPVVAEIEDTSFESVSSRKTFFSFDQRILVKLFPGKMFSGGNCAGLSIDFIRFNLKNASSPNKCYANKLLHLERRFSRNFMDRVYFFQMNQARYKANLLFTFNFSAKNLNVNTIQDMCLSIARALSSYSQLLLETDHHMIALSLNVKRQTITVFDPNAGIAIFQGINNDLFNFLKNRLLCSASNLISHPQIKVYPILPGQILTPKALRKPKLTKNIGMICEEKVSTKLESKHTEEKHLGKRFSHPEENKAKSKRKKLDGIPATMRFRLLNGVSKKIAVSKPPKTDVVMQTGAALRG